MLVRELITQLLDKPMDADVRIAYTDNNYNYCHQDAFCVVSYGESSVGIVGIRESK